MDSLNTEVLIIGGGPAGLSAAAAASAHASVTIVDDNPQLGGQIWRADMGQTKSPAAGRLIETVINAGATLLGGTQVFEIVDEHTVAAESRDGRIELKFEKLIVATGARERFLPFPGWTTPGVHGAGGLQALVKGGLDITGKRVVVAGTGPLLLAVADHFKMKGAWVLAIAEQTSAAKIRRFARSLWRVPDKLVQAAALRARLLGIPYKTDCWVTVAAGEDGKLRTVWLRQKKRDLTFDCDYLACGFHLVPNTELAVLLGCEIDNGLVVVNDLQQTSVEDVLCAGEPTGIGGIEASLLEGYVAGLAAVGEIDVARAMYPEVQKTRHFTALLNETFALRKELRQISRSDTLVCRCEDVTHERLAGFTSFREAKLQTRCGMGPCQGRVCGSATEFLFGWETPSVRPPIFPVKMESL